MQLIIDVDEKLVFEGFERPFTEEEKATLIRAIGNGRTYNPSLVKGIAENARSEGEWIPVSERLPNDRDWYLGVFKEPDTGWINPIPFICDYVGEVTRGTTNEGWILRNCTDVDNASDYFRNLMCVAWQPLPKPYKEGRLDYKIINRGKCMLCGKELTEGLFFCKECEQKGGVK